MCKQQYNENIKTKGGICIATLYEYGDETISFHHSLDKNPCDNNFPMHAHEVYEILYFISGEGKYGVEGNEYPIESGNLMIMRPSETHKLYISSKVPYERMCIHFDSKLIENVDTKKKILLPFNDRPIGQHNLYFNNDFHSAYILECLKCMICPTQELYLQKLSIVSHLFPILFEINRSFSSSGEKIISTTSGDIIREIIDYINYNINNELSLEKLSSDFFISKSYLNRRFKQVTGTTVWEYINIKRLLEARQLIRLGQPSTKVSQDCGFGDYSAFYRAYKKYFSVSPQDDRPNKI